MSIVVTRRGWMGTVCLVLALVAGMVMPAHAESPAGALGGAGSDSAQMPGFLRAQGVSLVEGGVSGGDSLEVPVLLAQAGTGSRPEGAAPEAADGWRISVTPITFWAFEIHGDIGARGVSRDLDIDFSDIQDALDWSIGGRVEVGRGPWSVFVLGAYLAFGDDNLRGPGPLGVSADLDINWLQIEFGGMYRLATVPMGPVRLLADGMAGARYIHVDVDLDADDRSFERNQNIDIIDPMVGLRLEMPITEAFGVGVAGNVGGFGLSSHQSDFAWAFTGDLHYKWQVSKTRALNFAAGYSILDINWDGGNPNKHELDLQFRGPILALSILF
jgi:hypothetical protein